MNRNIIHAGEPIVVCIDQYGIVYEGIITDGMIDDISKNDPRNLVNAEPQGWCLGTRELHAMSISEMEDLVDFFELRTKRVQRAAEKCGFVWVAWANIARTRNGINRRKVKTILGGNR